MARLLPWLLLAVCAPLLGHCGGAIDSSTETGNPPGLAAERLHIVLRDTGVEVLGDPGAVSAGATVSVTNLSTGARAVATARADGSVNVLVTGSLQDEYELTVSNGTTGSQTLRIGASTNGGAAGSGGTSGGSGTSAGNGTTGATDGSDLASASCDALDSALDESAAAASAAASRDCQTDRDCTSAVLENAGLTCSELSRRCGRGPALRCTNLPLTLACTDGKCQGLRCDELGGTASTRIEDAVASASRSCTSAADCSLLNYGLRCVASCGALYRGVASGAVSQLLEIAQEADATLCGEFDRRNCTPPIALPCAPSRNVPQAVCVSGQCDVAYVLVP